MGGENDNNLQYIYVTKRIVKAFVPSHYLVKKTDKIAVKLIQNYILKLNIFNVIAIA